MKSSKSGSKPCSVINTIQWDADKRRTSDQSLTSKVICCLLFFYQKTFTSGRRQKSGLGDGSVEGAGIVEMSCGSLYIEGNL